MFGFVDFKKKLFQCKPNSLFDESLSSFQSTSDNHLIFCMDQFGYHSHW